MKVFFDTSVLIACFWGDHPNHKESLKVFADSNKKEAACAAHSLAEVYAVMTRLPVKPTLDPAQVGLFLQNIRDRMAIVSMDDHDYSVAIEKAAENGIVGGRIYDALLLQCAIKTKADIIYTWNVAHFQRIVPEIAEKVKTP